VGFETAYRAAWAKPDATVAVRDGDVVFGCVVGQWVLLVVHEAAPHAKGVIRARDQRARGGIAEVIVAIRAVIDAVAAER
jgi:hypothetical protein